MNRRVKQYVTLMMAGFFSEGAGSLQPQVRIAQWR